MSAPNPRRLPLALRLEDVDEHVAPFCTNRGACLSLARNWPGMSCQGCQAHARPSVDEFRAELVALGALALAVLGDENRRGSAWRPRRKP